MSGQRPVLLQTHSYGGSSNASISPSASRKRKRDAAPHHDAWKQPFVIKPCQSVPADKPRILNPVCLILRSRLPLSYLDTTPSSPSPPTSRLFAARIPALEHEESGTVSPSVLIAKLDAEKALYAVERVQCGIYALCRLGGWVKMKDVRGLVGKEAEVNGQWLLAGVLHGDCGDWWKGAAVSVSSIAAKDLSTIPTKRLPRMAMFGLQHGRPPTRRPHDEIALHATLPQPTSIITKELEVEQKLPVEQLTPTDLLDSIVTQYLNSLYLSKVSLAYFAKGPLSRARAAFATQANGSTSLYDLTTFLRSMILSQQATDRKYRERLPTFVKELAVAPHSDVPSGAEGSNPTKKKRTKKMKLSKDGVYPNEGTFVKQWWFSDDNKRDQSHGSNTAEGILRQRSGDLRVRETLAQVILILEILAIEALPAFKKPDEEAEAETLDPRAAMQDSQRKRKKRSSKKQDLTVQADLLIDKLCIWQSLEDTSSLNQDSSPEKPTAAVDSIPKGSGKGDRLRSFCTDVIIPFYISRLPEIAASINRKLGGPRLGAEKSEKAPAKSSRRPGEAEVREEPQRKPRKPLARVATETMNSTARVPSLMRSATDSVVLPGFKREESEPDMLAVPSKERQGSVSRAGLLSMKALTQREVSFSAMSALTEAKQRRKAAVEEELKNAISALKKPNRGLAVKEFADSADQRRRAGLVRTKSAQSVQVTATPRKVGKTKDVKMPTVTPVATRTVMHEDVLPSSSLRIPSSTMKASRPLLFDDHPEAPRFDLRQTHPTVAETPARGSSKTVMFFDTGRDGIVAATPRKKRSITTSDPLTVSKISAVGSTKAEASLVTSVTGNAEFHSISETPRKKRFPYKPEHLPPADAGMVSVTPARRGKDNTAIADVSCPPRSAKSIKTVQYERTVRTDYRAVSEIAETPESPPSRALPSQPQGPQGILIAEEVPQENDIYKTLGWDDDF